MGDGARHSGIRVRALRADDADALIRIFEQPRACWGTLQRPFYSPELRREFTQKVLSDANAHSLVAEVDGEVVGSLGLHLHASNPRRKHTASIGMAVHDDHAGRGLGTALMQAAVELADQWLNLHRIELDVYTDNEPAVRLYRRFGFEVEGTYRDYAFRDGRYVDAYAMARLRPAPDAGGESSGRHA